MRNNIFSKIVGNFGGTAYIQVLNIHKICITVESDIIHVFKQVKVGTVVGSSIFGHGIRIMILPFIWNGIKDKTNIVFIADADNFI